MGLPSGLVTFVFTDIEGSTRLFQSLGEQWLEVLARHTALMRGQVLANGGVVVKEEGDGLFCAFPGVRGALVAAVECQRDLARLTWPGEATVRVRIGMHVGTAEPIGDDYVALAVHQAARVSQAAHGGQILLSEEAVDLVAASLPSDLSCVDLGRYRLKDFDIPARLFQVTGPGLRTDLPRPRIPPALTHNLPESMTYFTGRNDDVTRTREALSDGRLVTLCGPGGVGKTRLSMEVARLVVDDYLDGVWQIGLADTLEDTAVPAAIGAVLGVQAGSGASAITGLAQSLPKERVLLLLDNCEHVLRGCAAVASGLLGQLPGLSILATSREPLHIPGERVVRLGALAVPPRGCDPDQIHEAAAVQLFLNRVRVADSSLEFSPEEFELTAEICRRLDGIPLALELAAARVPTLGLESVLDRLERRFSLLVRNSGGLPHQVTLRASLEWSVEQLPASTRDLFTRLGVFAGPFDLDAVREVCTPEVDKDVVLDELSDLYDKSILERHGTEWRLLESMRAFSHELLAELDDVGDIRERHKAFFVSRVDSLAHEIQTPARASGQNAAYDKMASAFSDARSAFAAARQDNDVLAMLSIGIALAEFAFVRAHASEVTQMLKDAVAHLDGPPTLRALALAELAYLTIQSESLEAGWSYVQAAAELSDEVDPQIKSLLLVSLADSVELLTTESPTFSSQHAAHFEATLEMAISQGKNSGDPYVALRAQRLEALTQPQPDEALRILADARSLATAINNDRWCARTMLEEITLLVAEHRYEDAVHTSEAAFERFNAIGHHFGACYSLSYVALIHLTTGQVEQSTVSVQRALIVARNFGSTANRASACAVLIASGLLAARQPDLANELAAYAQEWAPQSFPQHLVALLLPEVPPAATYRPLSALLSAALAALSVDDVAPHDDAAEERLRSAPI